MTLLIVHATRLQRYLLLGAAVVCISIICACVNDHGLASVPAPDPMADRPSGSQAERYDHAIDRGLRWLQHEQNTDGSWGSNADESHVITGLAVLAYLGHGQLPGAGDYGVTIAKGVDWLMADMLISNQSSTDANTSALALGISAYALCEAYSMTQHQKLRPIVEKALARIIRRQKQSGLWSGSWRGLAADDDVEVSTWQILAIKSGSLASMDSSEELRACLHRAAAAMKGIIESGTDLGNAIPAVLCLQLSGEFRSPVCRRGMDRVAALKPDWNAPECRDPLLRWCLANRVLFFEGHDRNLNWRRQIDPLLLQNQLIRRSATGMETGCWKSPGKGERYGDVYATCLALLILRDNPRRHSGRCIAPAEMPEESNFSTNDVKVIIR
jgi:hypothetical protein